MDRLVEGIDQTFAELNDVRHPVGQSLTLAGAGTRQRTC